MKRIIAIILSLSIFLTCFGVANSAPNQIAYVPTGSGFVKVTGGVQMSAAAAPSLATDVAGILPTANGGIGADASAFTGLLKCVSGTCSTVVAPSGAVVGTTDSQTLSGKIIAGASNTLTVRLGSDVSGQLPATNGGLGTNASGFSGLLKCVTGTCTAVAAPSGAVVGTTDAQGLSGKTLDCGSTACISNLSDPTTAQQPATKAYVDAIASGLELKASCRLATAAALPANARIGNTLVASAFGALTVDGVAVALNDRVLVKNETPAANNGIFYLSTVGTGGVLFVLTRTTDADTSAEVTSGMYTFIEAGTANASTGFGLITADPITLNTTSLTFSAVSGAADVILGDVTGTVSASVVSKVGGVTPASGFTTWMGAPSGTNFASLMTSAVPASVGGTGITALGSGIPTFLAASYAETGTGNHVRASSPTITTPQIAAIMSDGVHTQMMPTGTGTIALTSDFNTTYALTTAVQTYVAAQTNQGRLSLTASTPITTTDVNSATEVYISGVDSTTGWSIATYDSSQWTPHTVSDFGAALGTLTSGKNYDVTTASSTLTPSSTDTSTEVITTAAHGFLTGAYMTTASTLCGLTAGTDYWLTVLSTTTFSVHTTLANAISGSSNVNLTSSCTAPLTVVTLHFSAAWTSDTARNTALSSTNGIPTVSSERYNGTFRTISTTATQDAKLARYVFNFANRRPRFLAVIESTDNWAGVNSTIRYVNNSSANRVEYVSGVSDTFVEATAELFSGWNGSQTLVAFANAGTAIGIDSSTVVSAPAFFGGYAFSVNGPRPLQAVYKGYPGLGYHYIAWEELTDGSGTSMRFHGDNGDPTRMQSGMIAQISM